MAKKGIETRLDRKRCQSAFQQDESSGATEDADSLIRTVFEGTFSICDVLPEDDLLL